MKYKSKFIECPYLSTRGNKCTHNKSGYKYCQYKNNINKCEQYFEWFELKESLTITPTVKHGYIPR